MKKIMNILFLSCLKASELIEKKFHLKLSFTERLQLKIHKMMCDACTLYEKQSRILEKGIENQHKFIEKNIDIEDLKKSITKKLEDK
ncbi:MAG: hypothetical protein PF485_11625 [Bacteroidales bacterium]|nr:hypothetical protein [Bacteroidales bacterium]